MEFQLLGKKAKLGVDVVEINIKEDLDYQLAVECRGNACSDIDYEFVGETNSYHFHNDGDKKVQLKVTSANYLGCGGSKSKRMRPYGEWDTGFYGICKYEANYR